MSPNPSMTLAPASRSNRLTLPLIVLACIPLFFVTGFGFVMAILLGLTALRLVRWLSLPSYLLLGVAAGLLGGLVVALISGTDIARIPGAAFNLHVWLFGALIFAVGQACMNGFSDDRFRIRLTRTMIVLTLLNAAVYLLEWAFVKFGNGGEYITIPSLFGLLTGEAKLGLVEFYSRLEIGRSNYIFDAQGVRFNGYGVYPNEGAFAICFLALIALFCLNGRSPVLAIMLNMSALIGAVLASSRTTVVAYFVLMAIGTVLGTRLIRRSGTTFAIYMILLVAGALLVLLSFSIVDIGIMDRLLSSREGSSDNRLASYGLAIDMVMSNNPLLGLGIKPEDSALFKFPIGSHSTFVSSFTKGGFFAFGFFIAFLVAMAITVVKAYLSASATAVAGTRFSVYRATISIRMLLFAIAWNLTEDVDAPIVGASIYFFGMGLMYEWARRCSQQVRPVTGPPPGAVYQRGGRPSSFARSRFGSA